MKRVTIFGLACVAVLSASVARAEQIGLQAFASLQAPFYNMQDCAPGPDGSGNCHEFIGDNAANGYNLDASSSSVSALTTAPVGSASAFTSYGSQSVTADSALTVGFENTHARSVWANLFTITGGVGTGLATFEFQIDGDFIGAHADGGWSAYNKSLPDNSGGSSATSGFLGGGAYHNLISFTTVFTYGTAFEIVSVIEINSGLGSYSTLSANLTHIIAPDGAQVTDASQAASAVPEPMSLTLLGTGVAGLIARRRRAAVR